MTNKRYFVPEDFQNEHFSKEDIKMWNAYLKDNYGLYILFKRKTEIDLAANVKYFSSRGYIWDIRREKKMRIDNSVSRFLGFAVNTELRQEIFKLK